jgi:hypothetical protein
VHAETPTPQPVPFIRESANFLNSFVGVISEKSEMQTDEHQPERIFYIVRIFAFYRLIKNKAPVYTSTTDMYRAGKLSTPATAYCFMGISTQA